MSLWSLFCSAFGLAKVFVNSGFFNPEGIGGWKRDSVRHVDVVVGCFMLSIGVQSGPPIGVQKGPLFGCADRLMLGACFALLAA
jgi:hypothetical protein